MELQSKKCPLIPTLHFCFFCCLSLNIYIGQDKSSSRFILDFPLTLYEIEQFNAYSRCHIHRVGITRSNFTFVSMNDM